MNKDVGKLAKQLNDLMLVSYLCIKNGNVDKNIETS